MASEGENAAEMSDTDLSDSGYDPADVFEGLWLGVDNDEFVCDDLEVQQLRVQRQPLCESVEASSHHTDEAGRAETHGDESQVPEFQRRRTRRHRRKRSNLGRSRACNNDSNEPNSASPVPGDGLAGGSPIDSLTSSVAMAPEIWRLLTDTQMIEHL